MSSKMFGRRNKGLKKATVLVSEQGLNKAIMDLEVVLDTMLGKDSNNNSGLEEMENLYEFLSSVKSKGNLDELLDSAKHPDLANKVKEGIEQVAAMVSEADSGDDYDTEYITNEHGYQVPRYKSKDASGSDSFVTDREEDKKPEFAEVPRMATKIIAADVPPPVTPATPPAPSRKPSADITQLSSDTLAKMQKALAGSEDLMNDKAAQAFIAAIAEELMNRPVEQEEEKPKAPMAAPTASSRIFAGLNLADDEDDGKTASFVTDEDTGTLLEDGGRTPEINEAHSKVDDNTGITHPSTDKPSKFAADMSTSKAVKSVEKAADLLKSMYLETKPVTEALDSRPVREAVESIYKAYGLMGEAVKALNKQRVQEEQTEKAIEEKEQINSKSALSKVKSSSLLGLNID